MDYVTQYYKNRTIQLQEELEQWTETYNYRLNEDGWGVLGRIFSHETGAGAGAVERNVVNTVAPIVTDAERAAITAARAAHAARARAAAAAAARTFVRDVQEAMQWVVNHLMDVPAGNWGTFAGDLTGARRAAYNRLFTHPAYPEFNGLKNGLIPGHGVCPQRVLFYNGKYRVMWWDEAGERWFFAGKGVQTEFGHTGTTGYITPTGAKSNLQSTNISDIVDPNAQYNQLASVKPDTGSSNGTGLGSVAALYMSYDPRAVSKKINFITENFYRN